MAFHGILSLSKKSLLIKYEISGKSHWQSGQHHHIKKKCDNVNYDNGMPIINQASRNKMYVHFPSLNHLSGRHRSDVHVCGQRFSQMGSVHGQRLCQGDQQALESGQPGSRCGCCQYPDTSTLICPRYASGIWLLYLIHLNLFIEVTVRICTSGANLKQITI